MELKYDIRGLVVERGDPFFEMFFGAPEPGICASDDFLEAIKVLKSGDVLNIDVDTDGGSCDAGIRIYNACKDLRRNNITVNTFNRGKQHSIGNIVMLGGEKREAYPSSIGVVHLPYIPSEAFWGEAGLNANDLEFLASDLRREEDRILNIYATETGQPIESLRSLMHEERNLSAEELKQYNFVTNIVAGTATVAQNRKAFAYVNLKSKTNQMSLSEIKKEQSTMKALLEKLNKVVTKLVKPVNLDFTGQGGEMLHVVRESGDIAVGDEADVDGNPDGTITLEDGTVVVVTAGKIESITSPANNQVEELTNQLEAANQQIGDLTNQLETSQQELANLAGDFTALNASVERLNKLVTTYEPQGRNASVGKSNQKTPVSKGVDFEKVKEQLKR